MMLTNLADVVRKSGLEVVEVSGWKTRGHGEMLGVEAIINHHTATPKTADGDYPSLHVVRDGRKGLAGPLAQLGLGRSGKVYVIAAGVCYHAGATFETWQNNWHAIGIEAEHDGIGPWPAAVYNAYIRLNWALCEGYDLPVSRIRGHKEVAEPLGRKTDPNFSMDEMRARVRAHNAPTEDDMTPQQMTELKNFIASETDKAGRKWALYQVLYGLETEDDRAAARQEYEQAYDAAKKAGKTEAAAEQAGMAAAESKLSSLRQAIKEAQANA
ncbi:N-acetylmuramoyl-L-alanine amidase [Kribbella sp. NPDC003505]|uniref:peptidoglycan recognition protein family protein n=1 Tax=Kribbella sp. NPDC003505 TaxID=3154448 RepID=UPI0033BE19F4